MKKIIFYIILLLIIGYSIYYYQNSKVERCIETQIKESNELDFIKIDFFEWNELIILRPYQNINLTAKKYKVDLTNADNSIEMYDNINTIIFF